MVWYQINVTVMARMYLIDVCSKNIKYTFIRVWCMWGVCGGCVGVCVCVDQIAQFSER